MDEIQKRLNDLSKRLSSVSRVRLVIGAVVVLFFLWLVSPMFHGLVMMFYVNWPFFVVTLGGSALVLYLWNMGDKDPAKLVALVAILAVATYVVVAAPLRDLKFLDSIQAEQIPDMPDTTGVRYLPYDVAARFGQNTQDNSTLVLGGFEPLDNEEGGIDWVSPREPNGPWNSIANNQDGAMVIEPDGSTEIIDQEFRRGEGMALYRNVRWRLLRSKFFAHHTNQYYIMDGEELLGIVPYISYKFSFPVMVPKWGGVMVVHPDGETERLTPEEATSDERFDGERLYPEQLARKVGDVWKYPQRLLEHLVRPRRRSRHPPDKRFGRAPLRGVLHPGPGYFDRPDAVSHTDPEGAAVVPGRRALRQELLDVPGHLRRRPQRGDQLLRPRYRQFPDRGEQSPGLRESHLPELPVGPERGHPGTPARNKGREPLLDGDHHQRRQSGRQPDRHGQRLRTGRG